MSHDTHPQFRWLERGDGEPVILLHGLMGHMDHWDTTLDAVAPLGRLLAPELPLFDPAFEDVSLGALADYVRRFMDALDIGRAVVGGNSLGGHVALELALAHPERVSGLVLTGSSGLFERSFSRGVPHRPTAGYVREKMEEVFYDPAMVTDAWVESVLRTVTTRFSALRVLRVARAARTRQHRAAARRHRGADAARVGPERPRDAARRRGTLPPAHAALVDGVPAALRARRRCSSSRTPSARPSGTGSRRRGRCARRSVREAVSR